MSSEEWVVVEGRVGKGWGVLLGLYEYKNEGSLPMAYEGTSVDYVIILRWGLCLYMHICVAHCLLIGWWRVCSTSSSRCELRTWIGRAAMDAELQVLGMVVVPPPLVHGDHGQAGVPMGMAKGRAAL